MDDETETGATLGAMMAQINAGFERVLDRLDAMRADGEPPMSHDTDIVAWSRQQAEALRQRSSNTLDWDNIAEEIEDVGRSETDAVASLLTLAVAHKLKLLAWPEHEAANHWRVETRGWLIQAARKHRASMHIAIADVYEDAMVKLEVARLDAPTGAVVPDECPWTLDDLLAEGAAARRRPHAV